MTKFLYSNIVFIINYDMFILWWSTEATEQQ